MIRRTCRTLADLYPGHCCLLLFALLVRTVLITSECFVRGRLQPGIRLYLKYTFPSCIELINHVTDTASALFKVMSFSWCWKTMPFNNLTYLLISLLLDVGITLSMNRSEAFWAIGRLESSAVIFTFEKIVPVPQNTALHSFMYIQCTTFPWITRSWCLEVSRVSTEKPAIYCSEIYLSKPIGCRSVSFASHFLSISTMSYVGTKHM